MSGGRDELRQQIAEAIAQAVETIGTITGVEASFTPDELNHMADAAIDAAGDYMAPPF